MPRDGECVLLVEDDPDVAALLVHHLESVGFRVRHSVNGQDALESIDAEPPDLLLIDIGLPDLDGRQIIDHLRADERCTDCPVVVTSVLDPDDVGVPVEGVLSKPFRRNDVIAVLTSVGFGQGRS